MPHKQYSLLLGSFQTGSAFVIWGLFPLFLYLLQAFSPWEILLQRILWSLALLLLILVWRGRWRWLRSLTMRVVGYYALSALLIACNWLLYIWAVHAGHVVEGSLGYYINPLVSVLLGVLVLHERLRPVQWLAIAIAALGVAWMAWQSGRLPWTSFGLALSFGCYGLLRKMGKLDSLEGLALETALLFPFALIAQLWFLQAGHSAWPQASLLLVVASGPATVVPLLLFAAGARRIPLTWVGLLQYIGSTLLLLVGILIGHESFGSDQQVGFACVWLALILFTVESFWRHRRTARPAAYRAGAG